jgi:hypothetical protein
LIYALASKEAINEITWINLGCTINKNETIKIPGFELEFSIKDCYIKAIEINQNLYLAW